MCVCVCANDIKKTYSLFDISFSLCSFSLCLDFTKRIPSRFLPLDEMYKHYEGKIWLERVTNSTRFVSMDAATSGYLPIHNATSSHISTTHHSPAVSHNVNVGGFPGQGQRLGDE